LAQEKFGTEKSLAQEKVREKEKFGTGESMAQRKVWHKEKKVWHKEKLGTGKILEQIKNY